MNEDDGPVALVLLLGSTMDGEIHNNNILLCYEKTLLFLEIPIIEYSV